MTAALGELSAAQQQMQSGQVTAATGQALEAAADALSQAESQAAAQASQAAAMSAEQSQGGGEGGGGTGAKAGYAVATQNVVIGDLPDRSKNPKWQGEDQNLKGQSNKGHRNQYDDYYRTSNSRYLKWLSQQTKKWEKKP
jgi:hypothetical protein